jgi:hypothetical protein
MTRALRILSGGLALSLGLAACGGNSGDAGPRSGLGPSPREDDPKLEHSWTMPAETSALSRGDLGTTPPELAATLMEGGRMPSVAHRMTQHCAKAGTLAGVASVALRFEVLEDGTLGKVAPDPAGKAGTCMEAALRREIGALQAGPAAAALLRIEFHPH